MTVNEANVPLDGAIVERPGNAIVCYVVLHGNFTYGAPSTAPIIGTVQRSPAHHTAVLVFDAQSGNLLIAGVPAQEQ